MRLSAVASNSEAAFPEAPRPPSDRATEADLPDSGPFGASATYHLSLWPFGTRTLRLFLLVDPRPAEPALVRALLGGMQYEYGRWQTSSQTRAMRSTLLAAHDILRQHNRGMLSHRQATAAGVVAAARGPRVYVAMSGEAVACSWSAGVLETRHTGTRVDRPLGLEPEPPVTLWSAPFGPGDRVVLACGASWHPGADQVVREILTTTPTHLAARRIADALVHPNGPARVLVADGVPGAARRDSAARPRSRTTRTARPLGGRLVPMLLGLLLLSAIGASPCNPLGEPRHLSQARQANALLQQAEQTTDAYEAHDLAAGAQELAQQAASAEPAEHAGLVERTRALLERIDRVSWVSPRLLVRLGPATANVVDLAVSGDTLYTLDVADGSVRGFDLNLQEQAPTPETVILRPGSLVGGRPIERPVAMEYVRAPSEGALTVVDQTRRVIQLQGRSPSVRPLPSSGAWHRLSGLASDQQGNLYVLDNQADRLQLLAYPGAVSHLTDPPRVLVDPGAGLPVNVIDLLALEDLFVVHQDGWVGRYDRQGNPLPFTARSPEGQLGRVASAAPDGSGGLFLAEPDHARIVETTHEGSFVRQLRATSLQDLRALHLSADRRVLYGLARDGIVAIDL
jgi:hypothetical protein